jgi:hypothetical protein
MIPQTAQFLSVYDWKSCDGDLSLLSGEKQFIVMLLRLFFGVAQQAGKVKDVSEPTSLASLAVTMRLPGERYDQLERQTSLPQGYFRSVFIPSGQRGIYVAKQNNGMDAPSFFVYESTSNLVLYIGPDFFHNEPQFTVVNCLVLDNNFNPTESHSLKEKELLQ